MSGNESNSGNDSDNEDASMRSQDGSRQRKVVDRAKDICGHCMKKCTKSGRGSKALQCDYCEFWYHFNCEDLTEDAYKNLVNLAKEIPNLNYYCVFGRCKEVSKEMMKLLAPTVKKVEENTVRIVTLEKDFDKFSSEIDDKIVREVKLNTEDIIENKIKVRWDTEKERSRRARNLIVTNIPEQTGSTPEEKSSKDRDEINKLFKDHLKIKESDYVIQNTWRLGTADPEKVRVLKVILDREYMIGTVLKATKNLSSVSDPSVKDINIFKDLCKEDRELRKKLVDEMKAKNIELRSHTDPGTGLPTTDKWVIRDDKVILVDKELKPRHRF